MPSSPRSAGLILVLALALPFGLFGTRARESDADGRARFENSDYAGALKSFGVGLRDYPGAPEPEHNIAAAEYKAGSFREAEDAYGNAATEAESLGRSGLAERSHFGQGNARFRQGRYRDAIAAYDEALRLDPNDADATANRALAEEMLRNPPPRQQQQQRQQQQPPQHGQEDPGTESGPPLSQPQPRDQQNQDGGQGNQRPEQSPTRPDSVSGPPGPVSGDRVPSPPPPGGGYKPMPRSQADSLLDRQRRFEREGGVRLEKPWGDTSPDDLERFFGTPFGHPRRPRSDKPPW